MVAPELVASFESSSDLAFGEGEEKIDWNSLEKNTSIGCLTVKEFHLSIAMNTGSNTGDEKQKFVWIFLVIDIKF